MSSPFVLDKSEYKRDLNITGALVKQNALFLQIMTGTPMEECDAYVRQSFSRKGQFPLKNPEVIAIEQTSPGNRERKDRTFLEYVRDVVTADRILSPSMVCYERPEVIKSTSAAFIEGGIASRKKAKGEMFAAKMAKDADLEYIKDCEQNSKKIGINSLSGMHGFTGNILYIKSGHSSLTSMCRTATGYGNTSNERLLCGARNYWSPDVTLGNLLAILTQTDFELMEEAMQRFMLHYPSAMDTVECLARSTEMYWRSPTHFNNLTRFVERLTPLQRAAIVYSGDLYHLAKHNDAFIRTFMDRIIDPAVPEEQRRVADPNAAWKAVDKETQTLATYLNSHFTKGVMPEDLAESNPEQFSQIVWTGQNVLQVLEDYRLFIRAFLVPQHMPPSVATVKGLMRHTVLASDTDSTIFTTQDWVQWYTGTLEHTPRGDGMWYTMTYIACQSIIHVLAKFSANMGVSPCHLHRLSMKNEYAFPVFSLTSRAKHYFAFMSCREGRVYSKYDMEIKGVALRSSIVPKHVIDRAKELMTEVLTAADEGRKFSLHYIYGVIWEYEQDIRRSIEAGEGRYLKTGQIKEYYADMENSNYRHYVMWQEIFADKYGQCPPPPYTVIKVPLEINNKTDMKEWLKDIEAIDPEFAGRFRKYLARKGRDKVSTLYLPQQILSSTGMPPEVLMRIDIRKLTYEILESFYMILESLGVFAVDTNYVRLVSDIYTPPPTTPLALPNGVSA